MKRFNRRPKVSLAVSLLLVFVIVVVALAVAIGRPKSATNESARLLVPKGRFSLAGSESAAANTPSQSVFGAVAAPAGAPDATAGTSKTEMALPPAGSSPDRFLKRTGDMTIEVPKGQVPSAAARITSLVDGYGGYILSSQLATAAGQVPSADLAVRIPAGSYQQAIARFSELGSVQAIDTSAVDVTNQVVDLHARLDHYRAVNARLLTFLAHAGSISEALAIQDRIDSTQLKVDELTAQVKAMNEQTSYGTLSISLREKGATLAVHKRNSFVAAVTDSWHRMVGGFEAILVALGALLPFALLIAVVAAIVWGARRATRARRPVQQ